MRTDADFVKGQDGHQVRVHRVDDLATLCAPRHIGLVGHDDEAKTRSAQPRQRIGHAGQNLEFTDVFWRIGSAIADRGAIDHAITIEEYRPVILGHLLILYR